MKCNPYSLNRNLFTENCECLEGYHEIENEKDCVKCQGKKCKNCNSDGVCTECLSPDLLPPDCKKSNKRYFNNISSIDENLIW